MDWFVNVQFIDGRLLEINPRISTIVYQDDFNMPYLAVRHALGEIDEERAGRPAVARAHDAAGDPLLRPGGVRRARREPVRALIVSYYFPPAGGGGVQRVLKLCKHLPAFGWDVDVLAPDDPKWVRARPGACGRDPRRRRSSIAPATAARPTSARPPTCWPAPRACAGVATRAGLYGRQLLLPDPRVVWVPDAARAAVRIVRERSASVVLTTSPPSSAHMIGNVVARRTGVPWIADLRDSWLANPHRRYERRSVRAKRAVLETHGAAHVRARLGAHGRDRDDRRRGAGAGPGRHADAR